MCQCLCPHGDEGYEGRKDNERELSARSRGVRDGDTVLLACMSFTWSWRKNNWLSFDGRNNMRAMHVREQAVPLTLHSVPGQPDTYTIQSEGGWIGLEVNSFGFIKNQEGIQMTANLPRERAARVRFHVKRFKRSGRVTLLCVDNNRYISHRDAGGEMVATYGNGGQSTEGDIDLSMIGLSQGGISPDQRLYVSMRTIPLADFLASIDKEGMDLDKESDVSGGTLLTWAAEFHRSDICRVLLERNADPLKKSRVEKMNALEWATRTPARGSDGAQERDQVISMLTKSAL